MGFADEIKELRHKCLLSQMDFAKEVGISFSTVNRWETGKSMPSYKALKRVEVYCEKKSIEFVCTEMVWEEK